MFNKGCFCC